MVKGFVRIEQTGKTETWTDIETSKRIYFDKEDMKIGFSNKETCNEYTISELLTIVMYAQSYLGIKYIDWKGGEYEPKKFTRFNQGEESSYI